MLNLVVKRGLVLEDSSTLRYGQMKESRVHLLTGWQEGQDVVLGANLTLIKIEPSGFVEVIILDKSDGSIFRKSVINFSEDI